MRPGWQPRGLEAKYDIEKIIQPERAVRFNTKISSGLAIYIFVNFIFVALATSGLMFFEKALPLSQIVLGIILILFTSLIWGAMFEGKSWAFPAEIFRLILIAAISTSYFLLNQLPLLALSLTIVLSIGFLFWLLRYRNDFITSKNTIAKNEQVATV